MRWGFVGPGRIAAKVAADLALSEGGTLHAVGSRSLDRARAFADAHDAARAYGSYGELLDDADVDAVYIATPHRQHHAVAMAAIDAGKHLLVEKAFTSTLAGTVEVVEAARAAGVFCMEAMWTRFQPAVATVHGLIAEGAIGEIRSVRADFGLRMPFDRKDRLWDPAQGGGALLDLGVYPVAFVQSVFGGAPATLDVSGVTASTGVDAEATLLWHTADDRVGFGQCSLLSALSGTADVLGTHGWFELPPNFHHAQSFTLYQVLEDGRSMRSETFSAPATGIGYSHELDEVHRCVAAGLTESPIMSLNDTVTIMGVLEQALHALGVHFDEAEVAL
ncbi:MAG: Gfo/Idh/MocA family oxidoreductase [Actinobacteria bacterium]|nr:Gfo/Idh/MocA family oxidoreductase [Actinomycetota bacterium]